ncbi:MAG: hypothetical protein QF637_06500 [Acidimicrobiales bacterium]|nr:hypothetical protein [Acidimicrobiales bacterium]
MTKLTHPTVSFPVHLITGRKSTIPNPMSTEISILRDQLVQGTAAIHGLISSHIVVPEEHWKMFQG